MNWHSHSLNRQPHGSTDPTRLGPPLKGDGERDQVASGGRYSPLRGRGPRLRLTTSEQRRELARRQFHASVSDDQRTRSSTAGSTPASVDRVLSYKPGLGGQLVERASQGRSMQLTEFGRRVARPVLPLADQLGVRPEESNRPGAHHSEAALRCRPRRLPHGIRDRGRGSGHRGPFPGDLPITSPAGQRPDWHDYSIRAQVGRQHPLRHPARLQGADPRAARTT